MAIAKNYDLAVIGSGPGGYVAGLYASRFKLTACVIEEGPLGGTCLNNGCIPTKSLINSASLNMDITAAMSRKDEVVSRLRTGIETLFRANKVDLIKGRASLAGAGGVNVDGTETFKAAHIIIASGSRGTSLPGITIDEEDILSSDGILNIKSVPASIAIIGGGVIGCEFASLFCALGSKVSVVEMLDALVPTQSREASKKLEVIFKKKGMDIYTGSRVQGIKRDSGLKVKISGGSEICVEKVLVAVGRVPNTGSLGLEKAGIETERSRIVVDEYLRTSAKNIYAIGDCVNGPMLAHKASYDGILACDNILGKARSVDYSSIPNCIWTDPEIASVGLSEEEAKAKYPGAKVAKFPYLASGKAYLEGKTEGFLKIIGDSGGKILGVEILGKGACELIAEAVLAKSAGITIDRWAHVVHAHPTLSEMYQEAAHIFIGTPIHSV
jgi:dihydrolipoamide dehydrogenase